MGMLSAEAVAGEFEARFKAFAAYLYKGSVNLSSNQYTSVVCVPTAVLLHDLWLTLSVFTASGMHRPEKWSGYLEHM